jgi:2-polyprenyl-3-methyl-5-hydroxy-6-metoxy-1,4-benzoquinol methylase
MRMFAPSSAVDIGCGIGTWLSVFRELGVSKILGVDGTYVDKSHLLIDPEMFISHDLSQPLRLRQTFDLAISLEVAEHISPANAQTFVDSLTDLAPLVRALPHSITNALRFRIRRLLGLNIARP